MMSLASTFNALQSRLKRSATLSEVLTFDEWTALRESVSESSVRNPRFNHVPTTTEWTIDNVKHRVAKHLGVPIEGMHAKGNRFALPVLARRAAIYLCRQLTTATMDELAKAFGYSNHSSAFEAMGKIEHLRGKDARVDALLEELSK